MKKTVRFAVLAALFAAAPPPSSGPAAPVIVDELSLTTTGYVGGVCYYGGLLCETGDRDTRVNFRNRSNGDVESTWYPPQVVPGNPLADITYDSKRDLFWYKNIGPCPVYAVKPGGTTVEKEFSPGQYFFGIYYDPLEDRLWLTDSERWRMIKVDPDTLRTTQSISMGFPPRGIARLGNRLWITEPGEYPPETGDGFLHECYLDGSKTGVSMEIPEEGYDHDIGGVVFDDEGYLWIRGGKKSHLYQVDIGRQSTTPIPAPSAQAQPTPPRYILDSGDYNGDGTSDFAIFRPSQAGWVVIAVTRTLFGAPGDIPAPGDYNGDGRTELAVWRPSRGLWAIPGQPRSFFGTAGDVPVPGDYDGNGVCDRAIFRPASGLWAVENLTRVFFGLPGDIAAPASFAGWAGREMAIFRPASGLWVARGVGRAYFGLSGDRPLPADFDGYGVDLPMVFRPGEGRWLCYFKTRFYWGTGSDAPVVADFDGDGTDDYAVFRPSSQGWWSVRGVTARFFGAPGDIAVSAPAP